MSRAPSMPMYWDAYLSDTTHLTTEEHGAYLLLLAAMWRRNGSVPDDDRDNARIVGLTPVKWRKVKARLESLLIIADGEISQKNLQKIWKNTQEKIDKNRSNGARGGRPTTKENRGLAKANGFVSDNPNKTIPEPEPYIDTLEAYASNDADGVNSGVDFAKALFENGVNYLARHNVDERQARAIIGRWRKSHDDPTIFDAFAAASREGVIDPVSWIAAALKPPESNVLDWDAIKENLNGGTG